MEDPIIKLTRDDVASPAPARRGGLSAIFRATVVSRAEPTAAFSGWAATQI